MLRDEVAYKTTKYRIVNNQSHVTWIMRAILLDWIQQVCSEYTFKRETFHLACGYIDSFLSARRDVERHLLQLVGLTALFLASKMEEVFTPKIENMILAAKEQYTNRQIQECEIRMLRVLNFAMMPPTYNVWVNFFTLQ